MKTAVEQLAIALYEGGYLQGNGDEIQDLVEQAKAMEKEQIVNAHIEGQPLYSCQSEKAEQYYNETYNLHNNNP